MIFYYLAQLKKQLHGNKIDEIDIHKIQLNKTTKNDIKYILGPPSFQGSFDSGKIYYSNIKRQTPLGRKAVINSSKLYVFLFDENDILLEMKKLKAYRAQLPMTRKKQKHRELARNIGTDIF